MSYEKFKPEEVVDVLTQFQKYLTEGRELECKPIELLGAVEYAKETVKMLKQ